MNGFIRSAKRARGRVARGVVVLSVAGVAFMGQGVAQAASSKPPPKTHPAPSDNQSAGSITGHKISH